MGIKFISKSKKVCLYSYIIEGPVEVGSKKLQFTSDHLSKQN